MRRVAIFSRAEPSGAPRPMSAAAVVREIRTAARRADRQHGRRVWKFHNPANREQTWTGRGDTPQWAWDLVALGHDLTACAVVDATEARYQARMTRIRTWSAHHGYPTPPAHRGRITKEVQRAYIEATGDRG
ncbi:H-NS family nucleoid-associated regulatory protein [Streptomyces sp. NPDC002506]|uniref:H-NS family nucleoid-associated regulatory protein n=1 Tax=Streptomyces sp. NPDC002506 TaxID=3154536 RepID=UPI00331F03B2